MKGIYLLLITILIPLGLSAQSTLYVTVNGIKAQEGTIMIALHSTHETFPNDEPMITKMVAADAINISFSIENLSAGEYAISLYHDVNDNEELDTNIMGIPKEPFGFSNDVMGTFGAPSFKKSTIVIPDQGTKKISITLKSI